MYVCVCVCTIIYALSVYLLRMLSSLFLCFIVRDVYVASELYKRALWLMFAPHTVSPAKIIAEEFCNI